MRDTRPLAWISANIMVSPVLLHRRDHILRVGRQGIDRNAQDHASDFGPASAHGRF